MTERVEIANLALSWMGEKAITSMDEDSQKGRLMQLNYIPARDAVIEAHDWSFAIIRFTPSLLEEEPDWGAGNYFQVPAEVIRVIGCWPTGSGVDAGGQQVNFGQLLIDSEEQIDWQYEDHKILTNEAVVYAKGVMKVEEEGRFSPLFVHALAAKLAVLTAYAITGSEEVLKHMKQMWDDRIQEAKTRDGLQGRSRRLRQRTLLKAR